MIKTAILLFALNFTQFLLADTHPFAHNNQQKLKESTIRSIINPDDPTTSEVKESDFYLLINTAFSMYSKIDGNDGKKIEIGIQDWKMPYLSAWAHDNGKTLTINFWGGYARINETTKRSFLLTVCHELGHVIGREPTHSQNTMQPMMSAEGQADYFAASECFKKYISQFPFDLRVELDPRLAGICEEEFSDNEQKELCFQVAKAGMDQAKVLAHIAQTKIPSPDTPSIIAVEQTLRDSYPSVQCRFDTYVAGALTSFPVINEESKKRPSCWYAQSK